MDTRKILRELKQKYPDKRVLKNKDKNGKISEIICEVEPTSMHPEYSIAIAIIDHSPLHLHKSTKETYRILKGSLRVFKGFKEYKLKNEDKIVIKPGEIHSSIGSETWIEAYSEPGWVLNDHILLHDIIRKYV